MPSVVECCYSAGERLQDCPWRVEERERGDVEIIKEITPSLALLPDAEVEIRRGQSGPGNADISLNVAGQDYDKMIEISRQITREMQTTGYFRSVTSSYKTIALRPTVTCSAKTLSIDSA